MTPEQIARLGAKMITDQSIEIQKLSSENERLRAAFKSVAAVILSHGDDPDPDVWAAKWDAAEKACLDVLCGGSEINPGPARDVLK